MTNAEYMREALAFQKEQRPLIANMQGAAMAAPLAKLRGQLDSDSDTFRTLVIEHQILLSGMLQKAKEFLDHA